MKSKNNHLYMNLYNEIKNKIINNVISKDTKLESIRSYAKKRQLSTTTVEKAYSQLLIEGYIKSVPKSGFYVLDIEQINIPVSDNTITPIPRLTHTNNKLSDELFDMKQYKSIINKVINYHGEQLFEECDPRGEYELRKEIQRYVLEERDVESDVNQIIIGPGIQSLLQILLNLKDFETISYLSPGFKKALHMFSSKGYQLFPQTSIEEIIKRNTDFLYISPSNIYPTGEVIKIQDRISLIKWAEDNNSYIIEDDYNHFIRYNSFKIPSIQSLGKDRVIYMGSFSKILLPSIRISFMILPRNLYEIYTQKVNVYSQGVSKLEQLSLALFLKENLFKRHTKKLYHGYKIKNDLILKSFAKYRHLLNLTGTDSNLHIIIDFKKKETLNSFINKCRQRDFKFTELNNHSVLFPYSGIHNDDISNTIEYLLN